MTPDRAEGSGASGAGWGGPLNSREPGEEQVGGSDAPGLVPPIQVGVRWRMTLVQRQQGPPDRQPASAAT